MNKKLVFCAILSLTFIGCALLIPYRYKNSQEELAKEWGINIEDYPYPDYFPIGYLDSKLSPEMSVDEVHEIIKGYDKVVLCSRISELYFYFGDDDNTALRIEILYGEMDGRLDNGIQELRYKNLETEDNQSRAFGDTSDCTEGLLIKTGKPEYSVRVR